jgi:cation transport protein ChaC
LRPLGSGAEYLYQTVVKLESLGIHNEELWELQKLVALEISKNLAGACAS